MDEYHLIADISESKVIEDIKRIKKELEEQKSDIPSAGDLAACRFQNHLYQPLFHVRKGGKIQVLPVALNESEFRFVSDLLKYCKKRAADFKELSREVFLLRNMSRGRGMGFFEARNFHPDFILWLLEDDMQWVTFVEPHGLRYEGPASEKIAFAQTIKEIEQRLGEPNVALNSFILSVTSHPELNWGVSREELEAQHILFMHEDEHYLDKLFQGITAPV